MATYPGFTYCMFNDIFKYITPNLSSNKNCKLNTTTKNHGKLRLCYEYFQNWIIEQAIPFKKLTKTNKTKYFPDSSADITSNQDACVLLKSSNNFDIRVKRGLIY